MGQPRAEDPRPSPWRPSPRSRCATGRGSRGRRPAAPGPSGAGRPGYSRCRARHGNMFSTASRIPVSCSRSATPSTNSRAYSFCQRNGGCSTTVSAPDLLGQLDRLVDLGPGVRAPDPLGQQEGRRVHRHDRYAVQLGERRERTGLLGDRVGPHHDLDGVVARAGPRWRRPPRSSRGRPRRSTARPWRRGPRPPRHGPSLRDAVAGQPISHAVEPAAG